MIIRALGEASIDSPVESTTRTSLGCDFDSPDNYMTSPSYIPIAKNNRLGIFHGSTKRIKSGNRIGYHGQQSVAVGRLRERRLIPPRTMIIREVPGNQIIESKTWTSRERDLDSPDDHTTFPSDPQNIEGSRPGRPRGSTKILNKMHARPGIMVSGLPART